MIPLVLFCALVVHPSEVTRADIRRSSAVSEPLLGDVREASPKDQGKSGRRHANRRLSRLVEPPPGGIKAAKNITMADELIACISSLPFLSVVFSYAAYTAVLISISTFGSAFVMALGFFDTETSAALVFGGIISVAGILGTPIGGYIIKNIDNGEDDDPPQMMVFSNYFRQLNRQIFVGIVLLVPMTFTGES